MSRTIMTTFPTGLGKNSKEPVRFSFEYQSLEGYASDLRYALSKYGISDGVLVDITTESPESGKVKLAKGKEGSGVYEVLEPDDVDES